MAGEKSGSLVLENTTRRDTLIGIEQKYQKLWDERKIFEQNAPAEAGTDLSLLELHEKYPKFMACMAYPYMNGVLHAGHAFTLSKAEFAVGYERMLGKRALFPMGFHCTGLPIKACADKLKREIEIFGVNFDQVLDSEEEDVPPQEKEARERDPTKFQSNKSKAAAKQGTGKYQWQIMVQLGIPREEIHKFANANHWIDYFPPLCEADCKLMGARIDWRRSFVTTDVNPYYDAFVKWQMRALKKAGKIKFGKRYSIFSPKDNQPCMDHDRQSGEGVGPQEYVAIKITIKETPNALKNKIDATKPIHLVAATLRPETMYGQTCCFVSPKIDYGVYDRGDEYVICTERAYRNMCFQNLTPRWGDSSATTFVNGSDLIGLPIRAPLSQYETVRILPMDTILPTKGTGVVTCVPSDSPDDYITSIDLKKKPQFYGIEPEWVLEPVSVLVLPSYGDLAAKTLIEKFKIQSPKDKDRLAEAKAAAYKEGFYQGVMNIGPFKGERVDIAKPKIRDQLVAAGDAFVYSEPEAQVISRSGDQCVVSLQDQWFTNYGEEEWKARTVELLSRLETYSQETRNGFEHVLGWMHEWALSRTYGLGTEIPWDPQYLVESLSDSTVYMSYYTICHLLHSDVKGQKVGVLGISSEQMTDEIWDYVFHRTESVSADCAIPKESLDRMRSEFRYFYPLDLRVSAKDLIPNHLTMFLYCHTALFPKEFWPRSIRANGHLLLNNEKMSKSTGNFMTLRQMLQKFGTDASRIALADAGDTMEDANFDEQSANAAILRLYTLKEWLEYVAAHPEDLRTSGPFNFYDKVFEAELDKLIRDTFAAYEAANYKQALKSGLFDLQITRDYYRDVTNSLGLKMHHDLALRYAEVQSLLILPIAPHFSEYVWTEVLRHDDSIQNARFPRPKAALNVELLGAVVYIRDLSRAIREAEGQLFRKTKKGKAPSIDPKKPCLLQIFIADAFPSWQEPYVDLVQQQLETLDFKEMTGNFKREVSKLGDPKRGLQFVNTLRQNILAGTPAATVLDRKLHFDEYETAKNATEVFRRSAQGIQVAKVQLIAVSQGQNTGYDLATGEKLEVPTTKVVTDATPGNPGVLISNI